MPTADQITNLAPTVDICTETVRTAVAPGEDPTVPWTAQRIARDVLHALIGHEGKPGPLDRYEIRAYAVGDGNPMVFWYCPRTDHADGNENGHIGLIARDLNGDQAGLTLGEILAAVLEHERDEHDAPAI